MTTAFVLSGGGSLGAVQVGMLRALTDAGIEPDLLVGTSVGAVNAAWLAGHPGPDGVGRLAAVWQSVRRSDVFPAGPLRGLLGFAGRRDHLVSPAPLRALLRRHLTFERMQDAPVPLHVVATDVGTGEAVVLSSGDTVDAVAASAAIPGVFPPVPVNGRVLIDGAVSSDVPIEHAVERGATTVYVLPAGYPCGLATSPRSALGVATQSLTLLLQRSLVSDIARFQNTVDLRLLPPPCPLAVSPIDFSHSAELVERGYQLGRAALSDGDPLRAIERLTPHRHDGRTESPAHAAGSEVPCSNPRRGVRP